MDDNISDLVKELIENSIWATPSVSDQPHIILTRWSVMESQHKTRHFVGYNFENREGRVSTAIQSFDPVTAQGVTKSGRVYQLSGPPVHDADAFWVWSHWARVNHIEGKEVPDEYLKLSTGGKNELS